MNRITILTLLALAAILSTTTTASADFAGQTILGTLFDGDTVSGDTSSGATDDNDGFSSGGHFFFIWTGPDDVWAIDWAGGDLELELLYDNSLFTDLDLFLYTPSNLNDSGNYSIINTGVENIVEPAAAPGTYYVVIDSPDGGSAGEYQLNVTPEPGTALLLGLGFVAFLRRSR